MSWICSDCGDKNNNNSLTICQCGHIETQIKKPLQKNAQNSNKFPKNKIPNIKLYKTTGIIIASILGSVIAGGFLLSRNFKQLGKEDAAKKTIIYSTVGFIILSILAYKAPTGWEHLLSVLALLQFVAIIAITQITQEHEIKTHLSKGGKLHSNWRALCISVIFIMFQFCLIELAIYFPSEQTERNCIEGNCDDGYGTLLFPNGGQYVGEFLGKKYNGQGTITFPDGKKYSGEWKKNTLHGQGTFDFGDGRTYTGEFKKGEMDGYGTLTYKDGTPWYIGDWKNGYKNGQGTMIYKNGRKYIGEWKNDKRKGQGVLLYKDGSTRYNGEWKNNLPDGYGIESKEGVEVNKGYWSKGDFIETQNSN